MEKIDVLQFDYKNNSYLKTNKTALRSDVLKKDEYRVIVHLCIFNDKNELLIQQRSYQKSSWAGRWDITCGGQVQSLENAGEAISREVREELGLDIDFTKIRPAISFHYYEGVDHVYIIRKNIDINKLKFNDSEVIKAKYASREEVLDLFHKDEFVFYFESTIQVFFDFSKHMCHYSD